MNAEKRGFITFVSLGLLTAAGVGLGVWHTSSPKPASVASDNVATSTQSAGPSATSTNATRSDKPAKSANEDAASVSDDRPEANAATAHRSGEKKAAGIKNDPFLAPNARVNSEWEEAEPTHAYRPENIFDAQAAATEGEGEADLEPKDKAVPAPTRDAAPTPTQAQSRDDRSDHWQPDGERPGGVQPSTEQSSEPQPDSEKPDPEPELPAATVTPTPPDGNGAPAPEGPVDQGDSNSDVIEEERGKLVPIHPGSESHATRSSDTSQGAGAETEYPSKPAEPRATEPAEPTNADTDVESGSGSGLGSGLGSAERD